MAAMKTVPALCCVLFLAGCSVIGPPRDTLSTITVAGTAPGRALVVVLPGFAFTDEDMREEGVAEAIHRGWPEPDVVLVGATWPYYRTGTMVPRLHEQVVAPARAAGYREIWLAGGSMGGLGVLLYEWAHPGALDGLLLLSPYLGQDAVLDEIREAGLDRWDPGDVSAPIDGDNFSRYVWTMIKGWRRHPERARRVWLVCGTEDRLFRDVQLLAPEIPPGQYIPAPGGHDWDYWIPTIEATFRKIAAARARDGRAGSRAAP